MQQQKGWTRSAMPEKDFRSIGLNPLGLETLE